MAPLPRVITDDVLSDDLAELLDGKVERLPWATLGGDSIEKKLSMIFGLKYSLSCGLIFPQAILQAKTEAKFFYIDLGPGGRGRGISRRRADIWTQPGHCSAHGQGPDSIENLLA